MRLREMIHTLLLGITTLAVAVSCDEKKPENPYPFDGDYTVTQVKTEPSKFSFEGGEVDLQELFLGKALLKLGTIHTIKVEKGKYQLANKEGKCHRYALHEHLRCTQGDTRRTGDPIGKATEDGALHPRVVLLLPHCSLQALWGYGARSSLPRTEGPCGCEPAGDHPHRGDEIMTHRQKFRS